MTKCSAISFPTPALLRRAALSLAFLAGVTVPMLAFAGGHGAEHVPSIWDLSRYWVNFLIFAGIIYWALKRPIPAAWKHRRAALAQEIERAQQELRAARARFQDAEKNLLLSDTHVRDLQQRSKAEMEREAAALLAETERKAKSLMDQARQTMLAERRAADSALQREVVNLALQEAVQRLKGELSAEKDREFRGAAMGGIGLLLRP